jgi:23S rRNA (cytosine1962-C5)-methyltransferase
MRMARIVLYGVVTPSAVISRRGADRARAGHPWIYRSDVLDANAEPGDIVLVRTEKGRPTGWALWSSESLIALRMVTGPTGPTGTAGTTGAADTAGAVKADGVRFDDRQWLAARLQAAIAYRGALGIDATAYRLVHGEADGLPALVVDRYDDVLVVQALCQAMDRRLQVIVDLLVEILEPRGVLARNDPKVRRLEGLPEEVSVARGDVPDIVPVRVGDLRLDVDVRRGQKTGTFLDQRENHLAAAGYARGRALDAFTYQGGFALHLARRCESVLALDGSGPAVAATRRHAALNGLANVEAREANVFDELRELEIAAAAFDTIVLDPPAFAKNKAAVPRAAAGYKEINLRALKLLRPGGHLITCSCSYNVDEPMFLEIVRASAADARTPLTLVEKRMQARDHPVLVGVPETHYLKCLVLRKPA